ncbi:hypothetical protein YC2023_057552 [Brassica napus]
MSNLHYSLLLHCYRRRLYHVYSTQREKLLPEAQEEEPPQVNISKLRAVLVTSLNPEYSNNLKRVYWERVSSTGDVIIGVYQASQEMHQQRNKKLHNQKALAEMYLLSLTDNIVTSAWSTFGYVAQGLGGMKPWILYKPENYTVPDPPCGRATSMEPCFHSPPLYGCEADTGGTDALKIASPFVRRCEDRLGEFSGKYRRCRYDRSSLVDARQRNELADGTDESTRESLLGNSVIWGR